MRFVLSLIVAVDSYWEPSKPVQKKLRYGVRSYFGRQPQSPLGSSRNDCSDGDWNTAAIKEGDIRIAGDDSGY